MPGGGTPGKARALAVCSAVTRGTPASQMMSGRQTRPPSEAMCTVGPSDMMDTNSPISPARRSRRKARTSRSALRCTPTMLPLSSTSALPLRRRAAGARCGLQ